MIYVETLVADDAVSLFSWCLLGRVASFEVRVTAVT